MTSDEPRTPIKPRRFLVIFALATLLIWIAITLFGDFGTSKGNTLDTLVTNGVGLNFVFAVVFLGIAISVVRWPDLGFRRPFPSKSLWLAWLPLAYMALVLGATIAMGLPNGQILLFTFINCLLVGISEETMFRGILFSGLRTRLSIWPAVLVVTACFGLVHVLNVFITGAFVLAFIQALAAAMNGLHLMAIRLRTNSILPAIILHTLWDFLLFTFVVSASQFSAQSIQSAQAEASSDILALATPLLFVAPLGIYGLFLLRHIGRQDAPNALVD